jgi:hypothetical protein
MVGQYAAVGDAEFSAESVGLAGVAYWVPDVLREVTKGFSGEVHSPSIDRYIILLTLTSLSPLLLSSKH